MKAQKSEYLNAATCSLMQCHNAGDPVDLRVDIWPPSDLPMIHATMHRVCFVAVCDRSVLPDPPEEYGRIPRTACFIFCGEQLPIVGRHPYALEIWESEVPGRYWAHAGCLLDPIKMSKD